MAEIVAEHAIDNEPGAFEPVGYALDSQRAEGQLEAVSGRSAVAPLHMPLAVLSGNDVGKGAVLFYLGILPARVVDLAAASVPTIV